MKKHFSQFIVLFMPALCGASGYALYDMSAAAGAMAQAYICRVDDPSAVWYNPAALTRIEGTELSLTTTWIHTLSEFTPLLTPTTIDGIVGNFFPTNLFVAHHLSDRVVLAAGVYNPFGLRTEWPLNSLPSLVSKKTELRTFFVTPSVAYKVTRNFSIGGGLDFVYADANLQRNISLLPFSRNTIFNEVTADGTNFGFNLGALIENYNNWTFAITYKNKIDVNFEGNVTFTDVPEVFAPLFPDGAAEVELPLPAQLMFGASKTFKQWSFEADLIWTKWADLEAIRLNFDENTAVLPDVSIRRDYDNSWSIRLGAEYLWNNHWALRGGYYFDRTPVPDRAVDPILPDGSRTAISLGFGYALGSYNFDLAYIALFFDGRTSPLNNFIEPPGNLAAAGDYDIFASLVSLGFGYQF